MTIISKCGFKAQKKTCVLEKYHGSDHQDDIGFKFIDDRWPNYLGNGPDGYPMNNAAFDKAAQKVIEDYRKDYERAIEFQRRLERDVNKRSK